MPSALPPLPRNVVVEGRPIPDAVVEGLVARIQDGTAFRAQQIEFAARHALAALGLDVAPAMRLADRLIQRYRRSGHLRMRREGRTPVFTWRSETAATRESRP